MPCVPLGAGIRPIILRALRSITLMNGLSFLFATYALLASGSTATKVPGAFRVDSRFNGSLMRVDYQQLAAEVASDVQGPVRIDHQSMRSLVRRYVDRSGHLP